LYENDADLEEPYDTTLNALIHDQGLKDLLGTTLFQQVNMIRKLGNDAVHTSKKIPPEQALHALQIMHGFTGWIMKVYSDERPKIPSFNPDLIPVEGEPTSYKKKIETLQDEFQKSLELNRKLQGELDEIRAVKEKHIGTPPPHDPNEAITRKIYIDLLLQEAGWEPYGNNVAEYPVRFMPTGDGKNDGPGKVDYVLWGDNGKPLAVVEAKRTSRDATVGSHQAKLYADSLEKMHGQRPVIFFTNGFETWMWDDLDYSRRQVHGFYKKDELELLIQRRSTKQNLEAATIDESIVERYYQIEAIRSIGRVLENKGRECLVVMATGTGKTRTAAALVDMMSKAKWVKRVLFLADRTALVYQARNAFTNHVPNLPSVDLTREKDNLTARIVFSTYQTMINQIDVEYDDEHRHFGVGHFDMIIFDEIHRSVYNKYKAIFDYFDGFKIGLTATPRGEGDRDTYQLFGLEPSNPTYSYELDQAVKDKFLVPYKVVPALTKFHRQGIKYADLSPEEKKEYEVQLADPVTGQFPDEVNSAALNVWLFNKDTTRKILAYVMEHGIKVAGGDRLGKTIIFARSHEHAKFIENCFNAEFPHLKGDFCQIIDNYQEYAHNLLKNFTVKEKGPHIAISVDMLDTGIDVPECVNLVFYKPVRSLTKFWQMIGRGTRLCKDLLGPDMDKKHFLIFDFCENFEFFGENPEGIDTSKGKSLTQRLFEQRLTLLVHLQKQEDKASETQAEQLRHYLHGQVQALEMESFLVRQHWKEVEKYRDPYAWNHINDLALKDLKDHIGILVYEADEDEYAKRFDLLSLNIQIDLLQKGEIRQQYKDEVQVIADGLSTKGSIPMVSQEMPRIRSMQKKSYWESISLTKMEETRQAIRSLVKFLDKKQRRIVITDLEDEISGEGGETTPELFSFRNEAYKRKVEQFILEHRTHLAIHKLRTNKSLSKADYQTLERMLFVQGPAETKEKFKEAYGEQPLGEFIRSIVGLDLEAAREAFSKFINNPALNAKQIRFVDTIIQSLGSNGVVEASALFEPPFTDIANNGLIGVFNKEQADELVTILSDIKQNTLAV
jgi:type I restriction enzyme R subunit